MSVKVGAGFNGVTFRSPRAQCRVYRWPALIWLKQLKACRMRLETVDLNQ
jgi:hypothetical protein